MTCPVLSHFFPLSALHCHGVCQNPCSSLSLFSSWPSLSCWSWLDPNHVHIHLSKYSQSFPSNQFRICNGVCVVFLIVSCLPKEIAIPARSHGASLTGASWVSSTHCRCSMNNPSWRNAWCHMTWGNRYHGKSVLSLFGGFL